VLLIGPPAVSGSRSRRSERGAAGGSLPPCARTARRSRTSPGGHPGQVEIEIEIEIVDVNKPKQVAALRGRLADRMFDLLFVNAGVTNDLEETVAETSTEEFVRVMVTNALSPLRVVEALADRVRRSGTIGVMSSGQGSVADNERGGHEVYRGSEAALNTFMRSHAARHRGEDRSLVLAGSRPSWAGLTPQSCSSPARSWTCSSKPTNSTPRRRRSSEPISPKARPTHRRGRACDRAGRQWPPCAPRCVTAKLWSYLTPYFSTRSRPRWSRPMAPATVSALLSHPAPAPSSASGSGAVWARL